MKILYELLIQKKCIKPSYRFSKKVVAKNKNIWYNMGIQRKITVMDNKTIKSKINHLTPNRSVSLEGLGVITCTKSAKCSRSGKRMFSVSKSKVAANRGNYTFDDLVKTFGLNK